MSKPTYINQPTEEDYKFYYKILSKYIEQYGEDTKITAIPPIDLPTTECTLKQAQQAIMKKFVLDGYIVFNMPVTLGYWNKEGQFVQFLMEEVWMTLGKIVRYNEPSGTYKVRYGVGFNNDSMIDIKPEDIIAFGDEALKYDLWNKEEVYEYV